MWKIKIWKIIPVSSQYIEQEHAWKRKCDMTWTVHNFPTHWFFLVITHFLHRKLFKENVRLASCTFGTFYERLEIINLVLRSAESSSKTLWPLFRNPKNECSNQHHYKKQQQKYFCVQANDITHADDIM